MFLRGSDEHERLIARRELAGQDILDKARQELGDVTLDSLPNTDRETRFFVV